MRSSFLLLLGLAAACVEGHDDASPDEDACAHLRAGDFEATTAAASNASTVPIVGATHKAYRITLADVSGGKGGYVKFVADAADDFILFTTVDVPLVVRSALTVSEIEPTSSTSSVAACSQIKRRRLYPLTPGTYNLELGPTTATSVDLVVERGTHVH
jgi:hypothetical protein